MKHPRLALLALASLAACSSPTRPATPGAAPEPAPARTVRQIPPGAQLETRTIGAVARVHGIGDLYLASQPTAADLELAKQQGIKTVINLRPAAEQPEFDEEGLVRGLGLEYVHVPIAGVGGFDDATITRAREALSSAEGPVLLHCASANRVGAVWIPWRVLDGGRTVDEAIAEARTIGLKTPELEGKARDYVLRMKRH